MERSWRFAHILLAIFFGAGAIWAFVQPEEAFWALASVIGFLFALKGSLDIIKGIALRGIDPLWVLMLVVGILEVLLGFWASQQLDPARAQLIFLWVGFGALFRGMGEIILAFRLRSASRAS
jgi:uncharacterized membrane protein HdeD (DUF308 family)